VQTLKVTREIKWAQLEKGLASLQKGLGPKKRYLG